VHVKHEAYDVVDNVEDHGAVQRVCRGHDHRVLRVRASLPLHRERGRALKNLLGFVIDLKMSFRRECSLSIFGEFFILLLLLLLLLLLFFLKKKNYLFVSGFTVHYIKHNKLT
jgi:hypothetical protein